MLASLRTLASCEVTEGPEAGIARVLSAVQRVSGRGASTARPAAQQDKWYEHVLEPTFWAINKCEDFLLPACIPGQIG